MESRTYDAVIVPDGFEVEAAVVHPPVGRTSTADWPTPEGGMKSKLQHLKESGLGRLRHVQQVMSQQRSNGMQKLHEMSLTVSDRASVMRSRGLERWHDAQRTMSERRASAQSAIQQKIEEMRPVVREKMAKLNSDMHSNAPKWAGIAAGAGLALGIGGRIMRHRMHRHHHEHIPTLVVVEATC